MGIFDSPKGGGSASDAQKAKAGGKLPGGSNAADRAKNGAKVANTAAKNARVPKASKPGPKPKP